MLDDHIHTPLPLYLEHQCRIAQILGTRTDRLIFATTTPVAGDMAAAKRPRPRTNDDIGAYNRAAHAMLEPMGVEINDLFSLIYPKRVELLSKEDLVHLEPEGAELCARQVAKVLRSA